MTPPDGSVLDPRALRAWIDGHQAAMLDELGTYVRLESPSDDKPALDRALAWLRTWLDGHLGPPDVERRVESDPYGDIVVRDYPGHHPGGAAPGAPPVLLLCHYDTVWPLGTLDALPFAVFEDRATGPGIFDMKAGLVQAVWALRALDAAGLRRPPVRLVLTGDEEIGSPVSRPVIEARQPEPPPLSSSRPRWTAR